MAWRVQTGHYGPRRALGAIGVALAMAALTVVAAAAACGGAALAVLVLSQ